MMYKGALGLLFYLLFEDLKINGTQITPFAPLASLRETNSQKKGHLSVSLLQKNMNNNLTPA